MTVKKISLVALALAIGLFLSEIFVAKVIRYPVYGVEYKVNYRKGVERWTNIRKPHALQYNVEGKVLTQFNNLRLPGIDINNLNSPVVVLGSSFVEALQFKPEYIATTEFQNHLTKRGSIETVLKPWM